MVMGVSLTVGCIAQTASMKVMTSQLPLFRLPVSEEMIPKVASTIEPSAFAMKHPKTIFNIQPNEHFLGIDSDPAAGRQ